MRPYSCKALGIVRFKQCIAQGFKESELSNQGIKARTSSKNIVTSCIPQARINWAVGLLAAGEPARPVELFLPLLAFITTSAQLLNTLSISELLDSATFFAVGKLVRLT